MRKTEIAVLIPHFNNPQGLEKSILSINETIPVDILVVDDGSRQKPEKEKLERKYKNGNVYFIELPDNQGIEHALNKGLELIKSKAYKYTGRLDCGDLCRENRFKKQVFYLNNNPEIQLLGSWADIVDEKYNPLYALKHPTSYNEIKKKMYYNSMFIHPTVIFRTDLLNDVGLYPINYKAAEDYAFFFKIIKKHKSENYPEVLLDYVVDSKSISSTKRKLQVTSRIRVILNNFYFGPYPVRGLLRNILLYFISRDFSNKLKKILNKTN